jgi:hypothetical protein
MLLPHGPFLNLFLLASAREQKMYIFSQAKIINSFNITHIEKKPLNLLENIFLDMI